MNVLASGIWNKLIIITITYYHHRHQNVLLLHDIIEQYHTKYAPSSIYMYIACVALTENFVICIGKLIAKRQLVPQTGCFIKFLEAE